MWVSQSKEFILLQSLVPQVPLFWQPPVPPEVVEQVLHPAIVVYIQGVCLVFIWVKFLCLLLFSPDQRDHDGEKLFFGHA
jgi:hypothetical protein